MSSFTQSLIVTPVADGKSWELVEEFDYHRGSAESTEIIHVPKGFITDFASIPRVFWNILPPWGEYGKAAVVHDYLYRSDTYPYTRKESDEVFLEAMKVLGVAWWKRNIMYYAVRVFAGSVFRNKEEGKS